VAAIDVRLKQARCEAAELDALRTLLEQVLHDIASLDSRSARRHLPLRLAPDRLRDRLSDWRMRWRMIWVPRAVAGGLREGVPASWKLTLLPLPR
jgi:hypothetical protein